MTYEAAHTFLLVFTFIIVPLIMYTCRDEIKKDG